MKIELLFITPEAERLIETAGRTSYQSFEKQTAESYKRFIKMLIIRGHESVLEHASASFRISGVSRALTHQLVRHRFCSFTQQSQRYVNEENFKFIEPDDIKDNFEAHELYINLMDKIRESYIRLKELGIKKEDMRFILPNATQSELILTANFRELRHIIKLRGKKDAQWEIRKLFIEILRILKKKVPTVFKDMKIDKEHQIIENIPI